MSVYIYDNAIVDSLRAIAHDDRIFITPPDNVIRTIAQVTSDNVKLPMISLSRVGVSIQDAQHPMKFNGGLIDIDEGEGISHRVQMIPIRISWLLDVWTKNREQNDNIIRELIFYFMTHPSLEADIPFSVNEKHVFNVFLDSEVEDNSDIIDHINRGEYFRQTLSLYTDDAYLWKSSTRPGTELDVIFKIDGEEEEL